MALTPCPECEHQISESARSCPNCGHPLKQPTPKSPGPQKVTTKREGAAAEAIGFVFIVVGMGVAIANDSGVGAGMLIIGFIIFIIGRFN